MNKKDGFTLTGVGRLVLVYISNPALFPADCSDPRKDAQGFSKYVSAHMDLLESKGVLAAA
jgi:hypothetical protein